MRKPKIELIEEVKEVKPQIKPVFPLAVFLVIVFVSLTVGSIAVLAANYGSVPVMLPNNRILRSSNVYNNGSQFGIGYNTTRDPILSKEKQKNGILTVRGDLKLSKMLIAPSSTEDKLYNLNGDLWWNTIKIGLWSKNAPIASSVPDIIYLGNIGIGTTQPPARLSVVSNNSLSSTSPNYHTAMFAATDLGDNESVIHYGPKGDWYIRSAADDGNVIIQDMGGKVGIGTSEPTEKLTINGNISSNGNIAAGVGYGNRLEIGSDDNGHGIVILKPNNNGTWYAIRNDGSDPTKLLIGPMGNETLKIGSGNMYFKGSIATTGNESDNNDIESSDDVKAEDDVYADEYKINSDLRLKETVCTIKDSLGKIKKLNGVSFNFKKDKNQKNLGFIAQDVEKILPELVGVDSESGYKTVNYDGIIPVLVNAMKEQQQQIDELKAEVEQLKKKK